MIKGFSRSGKDFLGKILCDRHGYTRFAFADSLKEIVAREYLCDLSLLHSQIGKEKICEQDDLKRTYRQILIDEDVFAKSLVPKIAKHDKVVITDWRYLNEYQYLYRNLPRYKINTIHILREDQHKSPVNDESEYSLEGITTDYVILNKMNDEIYGDISRILS
jgi:hypothetical protein